MSFFSTNSINYALIRIGSIFLAFFNQIIAKSFLLWQRKAACPMLVFLEGCISSTMYDNICNKDLLISQHSGNVLGINLRLFQTLSRNVSESLPLEVTMDRWSENCWIMIDLWSKGWLVYAVVSLFKRNVLGPEFCNPEIHPPKFYLMWATISVARICSMPLWDQHFILAAVLSRWILPVYSFFMLYISYSNLNQHKAWLAINDPSVIQLTRYLTQNGLAAFAWWSLLHALVDLGIVLKYYAFVKDPLVSTIVLAIVFTCIMTWFSLQSFYCAKYMRHTFSVHAVLVLGLGSMFTNSYCVQNFSVNTAICGVIMLLVTIMSFIHLFQVCVEKTHTPFAAAPTMKFEGCETVCDLEGNVKHKH